VLLQTNKTYFLPGSQKEKLSRMSTLLFSQNVDAALFQIMKVHGDWRYQTPKVTKSILRLTLTIYVTKNLS